MAGDGFVLSADKKVLKVWDRESSSSNFASVNTPTDINDVCHLPGTGLFMLANEGIHMTSYYVPQLGPAPRWCSFLDNLTEEMEEQTVRNVYEDFKFVERSELSTYVPSAFVVACRFTDPPFSLGLNHLIGTPALKPYMHGYFLSLKLYGAARIIANPFIYAEHREKLVRAKLDKLSESRIRSRKDNLPKVNRALAERIMKAEEKEAWKKKRKRDEDETEATKEERDGQKGGLLVDPRFKNVFEDPEFEVDEASREYALIHPPQAGASAWKHKAKIAAEEEEESERDSSEDALIGGDSSEEDEEEKSGDENSSEDGKPRIYFLVIRLTEIAEDMAMFNLRNNARAQQPLPRRLPHSTPRMVSASASLGTAETANNDRSASLGQRRRSSGTHHNMRESGFQKNADGGLALSWTPSKTKRDSGEPAKGGRNSKTNRPGIEYLGAGLEKGVERLNNLSEAERMGRSERRKNVRSGSKNVFRKL
jgi:ribosome biogenesis protein ENP2